MCEYCGCQSIDVIAELTAEHDQLRGLSRDLDAATTAGDLLRASGIAARMRAVLGPHTAVEEDGLFPALAGDFPEQLVALRAEHRYIDETLRQLADGSPAPEWKEHTRAALLDLFEHILKEQDGVFPAALATLSPDDWQTAARVRHAVGSGSGTPSR
jgi:hemerythrin-like domain-containing protein